MNPGLHELNLASHLVWWVAGAAMVVLGVVALLDLWDGLRAWRTWRRASGDPTRSGFHVTEGGKVRRDHYRRFEPGFLSLRSRGLGDPPRRKPGEWSPTQETGYRPPPREETSSSPTR